MTTISFKAQDDLQKTLAFLAKKKGINLSALIKLLLTEALNEELSEAWPNITVQKEPKSDAKEWDGVENKLQHLEK